MVSAEEVNASAALNKEKQRTSFARILSHTPECQSETAFLRGRLKRAEILQRWPFFYFP
jgi:hypothetical protein